MIFIMHAFSTKINLLISFVRYINLIGHGYNIFTYILPQLLS